MGIHRNALAAGLLAAFIGSSYSLADMRVREELHSSLIGGPPGIAVNATSVWVYYVQGDARRKELWKSGKDSGPQTAIIRHCDSGDGYYVDFGRKLYWQLGVDRYSKMTTEENRASRGPASGESNKIPIVTVRSRTVEIGEPEMRFGRLAHHFVTTATEFLGDSEVVPYADETIDGWYWPDLRPLSTGCMRADQAAQPLAWIGEPDLVAGARPVFNHSGPSPIGLAAEETRTVHSKRSQVSDVWETTTIEDKVVEFSESPLDPSLFSIPKGFRKVPAPVYEKPAQTR